jgi:hypothetical protein
MGERMKEDMAVDSSVFSVVKMRGGSLFFSYNFSKFNFMFYYSTTKTTRKKPFAAPESPWRKRFRERREGKERDSNEFRIFEKYLFSTI